MLRSDFDNHALWASLQQIDGQLEQVRTDGVASEAGVVQTIAFYVDHIWSFRPLASQYVALFTDTMLTSVHSIVVQVSANIQSRIDSGTNGSGYLENARAQSESTLDQMGPWPRPYGKGGQVQQLETLFEDLLERQRQASEQLETSHEALRARATEVESALNDRASELASEVNAFRSDAVIISQSIDAEKVRIDEVISKGLAAVADVQQSNAEQYRAWRGQQEERFSEDFSPYKDSITQSLEQANEALRSLQKTQSEFANLTSVAAGQTLANNSQHEANVNRRTGIVCYVIGGVLLLMAAAPFFFLLADSSLNSGRFIEWGQILVRVSLGLVAGSAATIAVRLGGRFLTIAERSRRMELELRAFDPFFANVDDRDRVDSARVELVDRTFGREQSPSTTSSAQSIDVTTMAKLASSLVKLLGR